ncbi:hypothetical protein LCGC14_0445290 [marine sediment metagenome]|uniref:Uncharacterized protein n=1 Tax=marine sediment metagenome TaxID=412755 RepID=A0A0F9T2J6_9ZZZZ
MNETHRWGKTTTTRDVDGVVYAAVEPGSFVPNDEVHPRLCAEFPDLLPRRSPLLCKLGLHDWERHTEVERNDRCRRCGRVHYWTSA